jgi:hypothetical protein
MENKKRTYKRTAPLKSDSYSLIDYKKIYLAKRKYMKEYMKRYREL